MTSVKNLLITATLAAGMTVAGAGTAVAATPTTAQPTSPVAFTQPSPGWNNDNWDNDRDRDNRNRGDWNRGRNYNWNDGWRFNRRFFAVSPWQCRAGHGHVNWRANKCFGGRFSGARLRGW